MEVHFNTDQLTIDLDDKKLRRVIINLIENACHAMFEQTDKEHLLKVKTDHMDKMVDITISDNGSGISDAILPRIFEPFFSTKGFGVGLGMPTVKRIIEQHHGEISIHSTTDEGTVVIISLPIKQPIIYTKGCRIH